MNKLKRKARDWHVIRSGLCRNDSIMLGRQALSARVMAVLTPHREARARHEIIFLIYQILDKADPV